MLTALLGAMSMFAAPQPTLTERGGAMGRTEICKWLGGKQAVFMLEFDDSCASHVDIAIPELSKRGLIGTFYINPGNGPFKSRAKAWEQEVPATGMVYGNHTFTHVGALSAEEWDQELSLCNDEIDRCFPEQPRPRLISYGKPGGIKPENWRLSKEDMQASLEKHHLVERPPFYGPPFHLKTEQQVLQSVDMALAKGEMGHLDFHGVGGDWHVTSREIFVALLDKLVACGDQLWVTDPVSWHQYVTERNGARTEVLHSDDRGIRLSLSCDADPAFYDLPLTLRTHVPETWVACTVTQGKTETRVDVVDGVVQYAAIPGAGGIRLAGVEGR